MRKKISLEDFTYRVRDEKDFFLIVEENCQSLRIKFFRIKRVFWMSRTTKEKRAMRRHTSDVYLGSTLMSTEDIKKTLSKGFYAQTGISQAWRQSNIFRQIHVRRFISYIFFPLKVFGDISRKTKGRRRRILWGLGVCDSNPESWQQSKKFAT